MSQNKTVIQGLEPADAPNQMGAGQSFYSRGANQARGTVVPGMSENLASAGNANPQKQTQPKQNTNISGKPVVGFLYSVSRTAAGEFWPLHIGQNTIGQNPANDVVLSEGTVSMDHAVIVVRKMKNPEKTIASISDARSTNGTMINGESLGFTAVECHNGDIITIGDNYELYVILIDTATLGLKVSESFIPVATEDETDFDNQQGFDNGYTRPGDGYQQYGGPTPPPFGGGYSGGTVGFDGSNSGGDKGGTIGM